MKSSKSPIVAQRSIAAVLLALLSLVLFGLAPVASVYGQNSQNDHKAASRSGEIGQNLKVAQDDRFMEIVEDFDDLGSIERPWPELHPDTLALYKGRLISLKNQLDEVDPSALSSSNQISRDLLELILADRIFHKEYGSNQFPLDSEGGFIAGIFYSIRGQRVDDVESFEKYITKLQALPTYFDQTIALMRAGLKAGKVSPDLIVKNGIAVIDQVLTTTPESSVFMKPPQDFITEAKALDKNVLLLKVVDEAVFPAYRKLRDFMENEYLPAAPSEIGVSAISDGRAYYEQRVRFYTTYDVSPEVVFETGQREVARIRAEMQAIIDGLGFEGSFADFLKFLREDEQFYAKTADELMLVAIEITNRTQGIMPQYFGKLPRNPLTVVPVPASLAPNYTAGRYSGGSIENHRAGEYWVNTTKLESRPLYTLPALTLHEGVPGHHTQIMLAAEFEDLPKFRTNTYLSAFGEGWALYGEFLGLEAELYRTPYEHFGRLTYEMWRACRLVVDPGMHYMGWTRAQAVEFMASNTALSLHEVNSEIDRYIGWPGQAVSYKMGELKIKELRAKATEVLGEDFDLRAFHDAVLANGSIPMQTLERIIDDFIREAKIAAALEKIEAAED